MNVYNTGEETAQLVVAGIMLVPLWPHWPTPSPYEVFKGSSMEQHRPVEDGRRKADVRVAEDEVCNGTSFSVPSADAMNW